MMYEGKTKKIYATKKVDKVIVYYRGDATTFNGEKRGQIEEKGVLNNSVTSVIFEVLNKNGVETYFIEKLGEREQLCRKVEIVPLEVIVGNVAAGPMAEGLDLEEGFELKTTVFESSYKDDSLGGPLINDYHAVEIGVITFRELNKVYEMTAKINSLLKEFFIKQNIRLIDFKLEFGRYNGEILLTDRASPDICRFWDIITGEKLDKDRFRRDPGNTKDTYVEVSSRIRK